jgi:hypothetical protein
MHHSMSLGARRQLSLLALTVIMPSAALPVGVDAIDPRTHPYNAVPNDGLDDRDALQSWIDAGCASKNRLLYLPPGDWHVSRRAGTNNIGSLRILFDGLTVRGAGRSSRILMKGSAILPSNPFGPADWWVFDIRGKGVSIEHIAIDGSQRSDTGEQTHLVQIVGPAADVELRRLHLDLPVLSAPAMSVLCKPAKESPEFESRMCAVPGHAPRLCKDLGGGPRCSVAQGQFTLLGWFQGGDCIRSLGEVATPVDGVTIADNFAAACDRSFVAVQRNSANFTITANVTRKVGDQVIDQEPSGNGGLSQFIITHNRFERGAQAQGAAAISLTGNGPGAERGTSMMVANNVLDGGIITFNVARISIEHNVINGRAADAQPVVQILKLADSLRLLGNDIVRPSGAEPGQVVMIRTHNTGTPSDVSVAFNTLEQQTDGVVLAIEAARNLTLSGNTLLCAQPSVKMFDAINARSLPATQDRPAVPIDGLVVSGNRVRGGCRSLARLSSHESGVPVGAVTIVGNQTKGTTQGVVFAGNVLPAIKPTVTGNLFEGVPPAELVVGPQGFSFNGANGPM